MRRRERVEDEDMEEREERIRRGRKESRGLVEGGKRGEDR